MASEEVIGDKIRKMARKANHRDLRSILHFILSKMRMVLSRGVTGS